MKEYVYQVYYITLNKLEDTLVRAVDVRTDGQNNLIFFNGEGIVQVFHGSRWIMWKRVASSSG